MLRLNQVPMMYVARLSSQTSACQALGGEESAKGGVPTELIPT